MKKDDQPDDSRERILSAMPAPCGDAAPEIALAWPARPAEERLARLVQELTALGARTLIADGPAEAREYIERLAEEKSGEVVCAQRPVVESLQLAGPRFHPLGSFPAAEATVSVTQADYGIAESGSLALFSEDGEGRMLSLLTPVSVTVLPASRILWNIAELLDRERDLAAHSSALIFVTGPSRTADIELTLTVGVHGPGELHAVILGNQ